MTVIGVMIAVASTIAQSTSDRAASAHRQSQELMQQWLGPIATPPAASTASRALFQAHPMTLDVEKVVALNVARQWWPPHGSRLADGASRHLQARIAGRLFDLSFGRAGAGVDTLPLFGGFYTHAFPALHFDGPAAGLRSSETASNVDRMALALASLERLVGQPRFIGALHALAERKPATDAEFLSGLHEILAQDVSWLFAAAAQPAPMNYAIASVSSDACAPEPCQRTRVAVTHEGPAFNGMEVLAEFSDGQTASARWDGASAAHEIVFEAPTPPVAIRLDPAMQNLLDDNHADQSVRPGGRTNVSITKWGARWLVWLQDAMLACTALI